MFTRHLAVGALASALMALGGLMGAGTAAAEQPPRVYSNGAIAQQRVPIIAWGELKLHSTVLGIVKCGAEFSGEGFNQRELLEKTKPVRGYGEVLGMGISGCEAPELEKSIESVHRPEIEEGRIELPLTLTVTAEMPLEKIAKQGEVCKSPKETLEECAALSERETRTLISEYHRRPSSMPWKTELERGVFEEEEVVTLRLGLHEFGESGTATAHTGKCYPTEGSGSQATFKVLPRGCLGINVVFPQVPAEFVFYGSQELMNLNGVGNGMSPSRLVASAASGTLFSSEGLEGEGELTGQVKILGSSEQQLVTAR